MCNFDAYLRDSMYMDTCNFELYECGSIYIFVISMYIYTVRSLYVEFRRIRVRVYNFVRNGTPYSIV